VEEGRNMVQKLRNTIAVEQGWETQSEQDQEEREEEERRIAELVPSDTRTIDGL
jgi:hypothetical protein